MDLWHFHRLKTTNWNEKPFEWKERRKKRIGMEIKVDIISKEVTLINAETLELSLNQCVLFFSTFAQYLQSVNWCAWLQCNLGEGVHEHGKYRNSITHEIKIKEFVSSSSSSSSSSNTQRCWDVCVSHSDTVSNPWLVAIEMFNVCKNDRSHRWLWKCNELHLFFPCAFHFRLDFDWCSH